MISKITEDYYKNISLVHRKNNGQYMTPYDIIEESLKTLPKSHYKSILEPSCGTGQFIEKIQEKYKKAKITGIEIDTVIYNIINNNFNNNIDIINNDFLLYDFKDKKYNLIIGNPPYFELEQKNSKYKEIINNYKEYLCGRVNIYSLFLLKSIEILDDVLLFVIPTSLLSSKYFEGVRKFIIKKCNIRNIKILNSDNFEDAQQQTMIFIIQKLKDNNINNGKYIIKLGETIIFNENYETCNNYLKNKIFIKDLNCVVKTGSVVWNQHKDSLTNDDKNNVILIYPRNLNSEENTIELSSHDKKKQYINSSKYKKITINGPLIAINRIIGIKDITLKPVLIKTGNYYFENHINIITGDLDNLTRIYNSLKKSETINFIKNIIGNTQLSKTELETMIPI